MRARKFPGGFSSSFERLGKEMGLCLGLGCPTPDGVPRGYCNSWLRSLQPCLWSLLLPTWISIRESRRNASYPDSTTMVQGRLLCDPTEDTWSQRGKDMAQDLAFRPKWARPGDECSWVMVQTYHMHQWHAALSCWTEDYLAYLVGRLA